MRRPMFMLPAACLLGIGAGPIVVAQSPEPSPDVGPLHVAMPGEGFAATFPMGWVIEAIGGESFVVSPDRSTRCLTTVEWFDEPIDDPAAVQEVLRSLGEQYAS